MYVTIYLKNIENDKLVTHFYNNHLKFLDNTYFIIAAQFFL